MISHLIALLLCLAGALCSAPEYIGKLPLTDRSRPSLDIYGGKVTSVEKYPCVVSLMQYGYIYGVAIILDKQWILTTAWNVKWVDISELQFRVGSDFYDKGGQVLKADKVITHPNYTGSWDWDIAVVKVNKPMKMGKKVKAATLATTELEGGTKVSVAGWGEYDSTGNPSKKLRAGIVTILKRKTCQTTYGDDLTPRLICSFDKDVAPCMGDFSAPLINKKCEVSALFAGGYGCTPDGNPLLYVNVPVLYEWVKQAIKSDEDDTLE